MTTGIFDIVLAHHWLSGCVMSSCSSRVMQLQSQFASQQPDEAIKAEVNTELVFLKFFFVTKKRKS